MLFGGIVKFLLKGYEQQNRSSVVSTIKMGKIWRSGLREELKVKFFRAAVETVVLVIWIINVDTHKGRNQKDRWCIQKDA